MRTRGKCRWSIQVSCQCGIGAYSRGFHLERREGLRGNGLVVHRRSIHCRRCSGVGPGYGEVVGGSGIALAAAASRVLVYVH